MLKQLKFQKSLIYSRVVGQLMADAFKTHYGLSPPNLCLPMPLHQRRLRSRGFNQTLEIARYACRAHSIPITQNTAMRQRETSPQTTQNGEQRKHNVNNAFSANKNINFSGKLLLLDDIITTGHTMHACVTALERAGFDDIDIWSVAIGI